MVQAIIFSCKDRFLNLFQGCANSLPQEIQLSVAGSDKIFSINPLRRIFGGVKKWLLWILLVFYSTLGKSQPVIINDSVATLVRNSLTPEIIANINLDSLPFEKSSGRRVHLGLTRNNYYLIILKINATKNLSGRFLSINNTGLDTVMIYTLQRWKPAQRIYFGGRLVPYQKDRSLVWHTAPISVRVEPSFLLIALKSPMKNINVEYDLVGEKKLLEEYQSYNRIVFFYIGIAFMISAIILLALFLFRKRVFAIYLGYMLCISFWIVDHYGITFPGLYPNLPLLNKIAKPLSSLGAAFLLLSTQSLIFKKYLQLDARLLKIVNYLKNFLLILLFSMLCLLVTTLDIRLIGMLILLMYTGLILSVALISFLPLHFIRTSKVARIFSIAMLVICLTTLEQLMANTGLIRDHFLNEHGMALGSLMENSIMAFGLLYGLLMERREKNLLVLALQNEQQIMLKKLISVQHNERKRIAADLHDNIGPLLAALKINFRRIIQKTEGKSKSELIEKTESIIDDSISEIRNIAHNLMPKGLSTKGLINTLEDYFENVQQLYGKKLLFNHEVNIIFKPELQINIYFIITELVLNAAKHSNAQLINVFVKTEPTKVLVRISDNGQGFEINPGTNNQSAGIQNAESRIDYLKGRFSLVSQNGNGTAVDISIPL